MVVSRILAGGPQFEPHRRVKEVLSLKKKREKRMNRVSKTMYKTRYILLIRINGYKQ